MSLIYKYGTMKAIEGGGRTDARMNKWTSTLSYWSEREKKWIKLEDNWKWTFKEFPLGIK